ncbi:expressed unknown protein [Seminavis robusta]|uniref:Uncharacterized protein n=1 Tax=Seminavis robusta TaxID=568900 RepID=A0A9N8E9B8_9STRA|nr:expressed unknown protein [Seminavis robusta]|eukprot:Sro833_g208601.1  (117) ;mRNA; f:45155-45505
MLGTCPHLDHHGGLRVRSNWITVHRSTDWLQQHDRAVASRVTREASIVGANPGPTNNLPAEDDTGASSRYTLHSEQPSLRTPSEDHPKDTLSILHLCRQPKDPKDRPPNRKDPKDS